MMREWKSQSRVRWYCRYHVVIVPKYRKKAISGRLRKEIGKILRELCEQYFTGQHFWARGYYVSTVGRDEALVREYIKKQQHEDRRLDQLKMY